MDTPPFFIVTSCFGQNSHKALDGIHFHYPAKEPCILITTPQSADIRSNLGWLHPAKSEHTVNTKE